MSLNASSALRNTMMALPVMAGLASGQAMANAPETSLRPQARPADLMETHNAAKQQDIQSGAVTTSLRPQARPFTLMAGNIMKDVYELDASEELTRKMAATLDGSESYGHVINWDGIELSDYSKEELARFKYELEGLHLHPSQRDSFANTTHFKAAGHFARDAATKEQLIHTIESRYGNSHLAPHNIDGVNIGVSFYGEINKEVSIAHFITPTMPTTEAEKTAENDLMDDYVMRHENCHGIDPAVYDWGEELGATPDTFVAGQMVDGKTLSLKDNYQHYMAEQFADACAALEYTIENNQEGLELMERVSYYRDAGTLNGLSQRFTSKNLPSKVERGMTQDITESVILSTIDGGEHQKSYLIHHDTGPNIRAMLKVGSRLTEQQKANLQADPEAFVTFVKDIIEDESLSPQEYMEIPKDLVKLVHSQGNQLSPQMYDIIERGYEGQKAVIEYNLEIPQGSINALREAAPVATRAQMNEYVQIHLDDQNANNSKGSLPYGIEAVPSDSLHSMTEEDRIIYANSYAVIRSTEEWGSLNLVDQDLAKAAQGVDFSQVNTHRESFHSRNAGHIYREAGQELQKIATQDQNRDQEFKLEL